MEGDIHKRLKADLLMGEFRHGQWLRLNELEKRYSASRFEVRKVLTALSAQGLISHVENYGYQVMDADPEQDAHHREVRLALELAAAPKVYYRADHADLLRLRELAQTFQDLISNASVAEVEEANNHFHRAFFELSGNPALSDMIQEQRELIRPYSRHPYSTNDQQYASAREHFEMLDCIEQKNLSGLLDVMRRHLYRVPPAKNAVQDSET